MAPRSSDPDSVPPFAASCLPHRRAVQLQDRADTELRCGRQGCRQTRAGRAGVSGVYPQEEGQEPYDEVRICLVSLRHFLLIPHVFTLRKT